MLASAIGLGSNSLRMLVADIDIKNKMFENIFRGRDALRVFAALQNTKCISDDMINQAMYAINSMKNTALELGATSIDLFATSATRDANNKDIFINKIYEHTGLKMQVLSGEDEALLSYIGASKGNKSGVIDIGGGSTEFAIGEKRNLDTALSLQIGAVRSYRKYPVLCKGDIANCILDIKSIINSKLDSIKSSISKVKPNIWYGVGGAFTSLSAIVQNIAWDNYTNIHGFTLSFDDVKHSLERFSELSLDQRKAMLSVQPGRADILVNGIAILFCCMQMLEIENITVSTKGNLDGYLYNKYILGY